ncbi:hypothetical protein Afil01_06950 [Actinorhabdospora filicis]|uniref:Uncharacterized protein n=1 Tax=Actinorhabdospora filicis TaxID=1785913 RepID=A0A9W6SGI8_9ACTN|nr:hypothetical protein [Actinorhabdospora filicis]GLZ75888.1 hypothetical protein Afil01_06950 [Actinorhabdospora filicis]
MSGSYAYLLGSFTALPEALAAARRLLDASEGATHVEAHAGIGPGAVARFTGLPAPTEIRFVVDEDRAALAESLLGATVETLHRGRARTMAARLDEEVAANLTRLTDVLVDVELGGVPGIIEDAFCARIGADPGDLLWECEWPGAVPGGNGVQLTINGAGLYREENGTGHELYVFVSDACPEPDAVAARLAASAGLTVGKRSHED